MGTLEAEKESRIGKIGASDVGALLGYNPWSSPANQTAIILGQITVEGNTRMDFGKKVQPIIAQMVEERTGLVCIEDEKTIYHPKYPWMQATPDYSIGEWEDWDGKKEQKLINAVPLELKYVGEYVSDHWGFDGDPNGVPPYVALQCIQQANLLGKNEVMVAALIGGRDLRLYDLEIKDRDIQALETATVNFYEKWILPGLIPPLDHRDVETMKQLYPVSIPKPVTAPDSFIEDHVGPYVHAKEKVKEWEETADHQKAEIQRYMCEFDTLLNEQGDPLVTWKKSKDGQETNYKELALALAREFEPDEYAQAFKDHTKTRTGSRSFLLKKAAKGEK